MSQTLRTILSDTKKVFSTKWSPSQITVPAWAILSFVTIISFRSLIYGLELMMWVGTPVAEVMAFVTILGTQTWGLYIIIALTIYVIGLITRNVLIVTIGNLLCAAVWLALSLVVFIGWGHAGTGGRFALAIFCTALVWTVMFFVQLRNIKRNGIES